MESSEWVEFLPPRSGPLPMFPLLRNLHLRAQRFAKDREPMTHCIALSEHVVDLFSSMPNLTSLKLDQIQGLDTVLKVLEMPHVDASGAPELAMALHLARRKSLSIHRCLLPCLKTLIITDIEGLVEESWFDQLEKLMHDRPALTSSVDGYDDAPESISERICANRKHTDGRLKVWGR